MIQATPISGRQLSTTLTAMAHDFLAEWQRRFDRPGSSPCASLQGETLILRMERALTPAELALTGRSGGDLAVGRQLESLLDDLYPWMAEQVEARLHCFVAESHVSLDLADQSVTYRISLRDMPRVLIPAQTESGCKEADRG